MSICSTSEMFQIKIVFVLFFVFVSARKDCEKHCFEENSGNCITCRPPEIIIPIPIEDFIIEMGYPVEKHNITTEDGYILTYHRIPYGKDTSNEISRKPVLLQHGLFSSSAVWVLSADALAYTLADAGFDVWLGNSRGNTYSRKHIKYDPLKDKRKFWDFSWHEMGYYDLPASIDYILESTHFDDLTYIGHSMGTTMFFVLGSTRPNYMKKVQAAVTLAPITDLQNIRSTVVKDLFKLSPILFYIQRVFGIYYLFTSIKSTIWFDEHICSKPSLQFICRDLIFSLTGYDEDEFNTTLLPLILNYVPAGTSFKELEHFRQIGQTGFKQYDYGYIGNIVHYRTIHPPSYNVSNVVAPVYVYYSSNDWLADPLDVTNFVKLLPNVRKVTKVPDEKFNHIDFMWATHAKRLLYNDIIKTLNSLPN